jgi:hypothetical protein
MCTSKTQKTATTEQLLLIIKFRKLSSLKCEEMFILVMFLVLQSMLELG